MTFSIPQCLGCVHISTEQFEKGHPHYRISTCKAFPEGIPGAILANHYTHTIPYPGDNGILFELKEGGRHPGLGPLCSYCAHWEYSTEVCKAAACKAFPEGIPDNFVQGIQCHIIPYPGDNGVLFEPRENLAEIGKTAVVRLLERAKRQDQCLRCTHYIGGRPQTCKAFPKFTPGAILLGYHDHAVPYQGDNGILFLAKEETE